MIASQTRCRPLKVAVLVAAWSFTSALGISRLAWAPHARSAPPTSSASVTHGRQLFGQSCAHCHGADARGNGEDGDGPNLSRLAIGNARIAAIIRTGIPEEMPSFAKKHGLADIVDLTAYLRTLR